MFVVTYINTVMHICLFLCSSQAIKVREALRDYLVVEAYV